MNTQLSSMLAAQHVQDLQQTANRHRVPGDAPRRSKWSSVPRAQVGRLATHLRLGLRQASNAALTSANPRPDRGHEQRC
jgi:hypothetical protein